MSHQVLNLYVMIMIIYLIYLGLKALLLLLLLLYDNIPQDDNGDEDLILKYEKK
jgi:hypothetical protein